jgi:hypothetical protein
MPTMSDARLGAAAGCLFVLLGVVSGPLLPQPPDAGASATTVLHYFAGHEARIVTASTLAAAAAVSLAFFFGALAGRLADDRWAARTVTAGGAITVTVSVLGAIGQAAVARAADGLGATAALRGAFQAERGVFFIAPGLAMAVVAAATARGLKRTGAPGWLTALSGLVAAVALGAGLAGVASGASAVTGIGFAGFLLTLAWVLAVSVTLWRERVSSAAISLEPAARAGSPSAAPGY